MIRDCFRFLLLLTAVNVAAADDASAWLERMSHAMQNLNYRGEFVHTKGDNSQTLAIIHGVFNGEVHERLWSLDGPVREIVRDDKQVRCILADQKTVVVEPRASASMSGPAFPQLTPELQRFYDFVAHSKTQRIAGRPTRVLDVRPRDPYRYGYRLWLDVQTALPLRSDLVSGDGEVIEKLYFIHVSFPESIPATDLKPELSAEGYSQYRRPGPDPVGQQSIIPEWVIGDLPRGFRLEGVQRRPGVNADSQVEHLVFSDGLASVSVFIEELPEGEETMVGLADTGQLYGTVYGRFQITTMGDVPSRTLRRIGRSARPVSSF